VDRKLKGTDLFSSNNSVDLLFNRIKRMREMPRMGRVVLPNYPHHVVQRAHNRQVVFAGDADYCRYLEDLDEAKESDSIELLI